MDSSTSFPLPSVVPSFSCYAKLFVGGIPWEATAESLKECFIKYGRVVSTNVITDRYTGRSKGYGFVEFEDPAKAEIALGDPKGHVILCNKVNVKKARRRHQNNTNQCQDQDQNSSHTSTRYNPKKIFVGGLPSNLTKKEFSNYFKYFGEINEVTLLHDMLGRPRGFGFIKFNSEEAVVKVLQNKYYELKNRKVEVKMAMLKRDNIGVGRGYGFGNCQDSFCPFYNPSYVGECFTGYYSCMPAYYWSPLERQVLVMPFGNTSSSLYLGQDGYLIGYNAPIGYMI